MDSGFHCVCVCACMCDVYKNFDYNFGTSYPVILQINPVRLLQNKSIALFRVRAFLFFGEKKRIYLLVSCSSWKHCAVERWSVLSCFCDFLTANISCWGGLEKHWRSEQDKTRILEDFKHVAGMSRERKHAHPVWKEGDAPRRGIDSVVRFQFLRKDFNI